MDHNAIIVDGLGKKYRIGINRARYKTIREQITNAAARPFRSLFSLYKRSSGRMATSRPTEFWALRDVSFEIPAGAVVGVIGRNGAGKSTLLKILSRITEPTSGSAEIHGRVGSLLEVGTGFHPELTGRENIFLNGAILGMRRQEISRRFDDIVAFAEVDRFLDTPVKHYSSGMYLRLAFAVAAHLETEVLLIDEILAVGDAGFQEKSLKKMHDVARGGRTVLFVSHNMGAISRLCDTCIYLDNGILTDYGRTSDVIARYLSAHATSRAQWIREETSHTDSPVYFQGVSLQPGAAGAASYRGDESIHIHLDYVVTRELLNVGINVRVYAIDGVPICSSADTDNLGLAAMRRLPGIYRATLTLPGHTLAPGKYSLMAAAHAPSQCVYDLIDHAVTFEVTSVGSLTSLDGRLGYFAPLFQWQTTVRPPAQAAPRPAPKPHTYVSP